MQCQRMSTSPAPPAVPPAAWTSWRLRACLFSNALLPQRWAKLVVVTELRAQEEDEATASGCSGFLCFLPVSLPRSTQRAARPASSIAGSVRLSAYSSLPAHTRRASPPPPPFWLLRRMHSAAQAAAPNQNHTCSPRSRRRQNVRKPGLYEYE